MDGDIGNGRSGLGRRLRAGLVEAPRPDRFGDTGASTSERRRCVAREQPIMAGAHASAPGGGEWCRLSRAGCMLKAFERDGRCIILFSKRCNAS